MKKDFHNRLDTDPPKNDWYTRLVQGASGTLAVQWPRADNKMLQKLEVEAPPLAEKLREIETHLAATYLQIAKNATEDLTSNNYDIEHDLGIPQKYKDRVRDLMRELAEFYNSAGVEAQDMERRLEAMNYALNQSAQNFRVNKSPSHKSQGISN